MTLKCKSQGHSDFEAIYLAKEQSYAICYYYEKAYVGSPMTLSYLTLSDLEKSNSRSLRFRSLLSRKRAELGHMFLLNINRKPYVGSPMALSDLTLSDLEKSTSKSLRYQRLIYRKAAELGHMLLLDTNRKSYMGSSKLPSHLALSDIERSKLRC